MRQGVKLVSLIAITMLLFACASTDKKPDDEGAAGVEDYSDGGSAETSGAGQSGPFQGHPLDDPSSPLYQRVIYFDYDSSTITANDREVLAAHAAYLVSHPDVWVSLEGHADERGSREYNIALGERRAQAVRRILDFNGVPRKQLSTVSYGEEKPVAFGHDDTAWSLNRRVEMVYPRY